MLGSFKTILRHADDHSRCRRQRRCIRFLPELASCLEDRLLLSAAGGQAHAAEAAQSPANAKAGKEVTNLFESILQTNPTGAQLTRFVHELRSGLSVRALRKELTAEAGARQGAQAQASMNVVIVNGRPPAPATASTGSAAAGKMNPLSIMQGLSAPGNTIVSPIHVSQVPAGTHISIAFAPAPTQTPVSTSGGAVAGSMSGTMSSTSTMTGTNSTTGMTGMNSTTGMSMSATGSMSSTPATSAAIGTPSMLPFSPLPFSPLPVVPLASTPMMIASM